MQTLQQARLTSKPPPLPGPSTSSGFSALAKAYDPSNKPPLVKAGGILRHRTINPMQEEPKPAEPDVKTIELLSRFFISSGVPLETVQERTFLDLVRHINPKIVLPEKTAMAKCVEKLGATTKPFVNFQKTVGPLCVTIDTDGTDDEKYLVFSIHYFEDLYERKQIVYLRKLLLSELDADSLLISVRRAVNNYTYVNVKFSNIVCPDDDVYNLVVNSDVVKRYHVCFYHYMKQFVFDLIEIEEFSRGLTELREFVRHIKKSADLYGKFRRMQLSKNAELDVPMIDDGPWENTSLFLTRCLVLHDTFTDFCERFNVTSYINNKTFNNLVYFQRLLSECVKHCRELSTPNSSISQVIPAIISLQRYIKNNDMGYRYTRIIRESLHTCFRQYLDGNMTLLYEMATLMDARYAYRDVLTPLRWKQLELKVAEDFVRTDAAMEKCFYQDLSLMNPEDRRTAIMAEFAHYRQVSFVERPEEAESPFLWWGRRHTDMEFLAVMAREYLAAPAVSVDATYYFANGGKFQHLCNTYSYGELESCLSLAGAHQKFVGRGASTDNITPDMIESLNSTANRLQKRTYFGLYTHGCDDVSTDREVAEIIGQPYPPIPTMAIRGHGLAQEEKPPTMAIPPIRTVLPNTQPVRQTKPSAITARPIQYKGAALGAVPKAIPIRQVPLQKLHPSQEKPMEEEKPAVFDHNAISKTKYWPQPKPLPQEEKPKDLLEKEVKQESQEPLLEKVKDEPLEEEPSTSLVGKVSNAVRKMSPLPTPANIIQHQQNQVQLNSPTLSQQGPPSTIIQANGIQTKRIIKNIHAPMPQNITPHNFVQKFAQKQNFVQKFTNRGVPQVPPANVQPPAGIRSPMTFQRSGQPSSSALPLHEPKIEEQLILAEQPDDFKMEPLDDFDDFNVVDDFSTYTSPRVIVHCEKLNDQSISNAYARHRMNMELQKRRSCNRRCAVCGHLEQHELLKNVTIDNEKLLIMLGCIYRGEFTIMQAQIFMSRESKTYICRVHFGETLDEIHTMLRLTCAEDIHTCSVDMIQNIMITITALRPHVTAQQLRKLLYDFAERYKHLKDTRNDLMGPDDYSRSKAHEPNDVDEQEIIPKVYRQPRKQVLEADQHDGTVKVIEQEDFKLPTAKPSDHEDCDNPGVCCFCSKQGDRKCMLKVPRSEDRLARWIEKLGPEFEKRLKSGSDNLICRQHFPEAAFSSRGRLLKGMIPDAEPEKVEVTYRIQGNKFLKLDEQKSGTDKKSSIDLEKGHSDRQDEARMRKMIAETNEFERHLNIQDHEVSPERSLSPIEMSPQPTTSAAVETRAPRTRKSVNRSVTPDDGGKLAKNDTDYNPAPKRRGRPPKSLKRKAKTPPPEEDEDYEDDEEEMDEEEFTTADDDDFVPEQEIRRSRRKSRKVASGSDSDDGPVRYIESRTGLKTVKMARKAPTRNSNKQ